MHWFKNRNFDFESKNVIDQPGKAFSVILWNNYDEIEKYRENNRKVGEREMRYPKRNRHLAFEKLPDGSVEILDYYTDEKWCVSKFAAWFLKKMDGHTNPYKVTRHLDRKDVACLLENLENEGLINEEGVTTSLGLGSLILPLWKPRHTGTVMKVAGLWNSMLMVLWIPVLIAGLMILVSGDWEGYAGIGWTFFGYLFGLLGGVVLHELSHAAACLSYGGKFYEMGITILHFLPGAYVLIDYDNVRNRFRRAQISAAGVEANFLISGICLCLLKTGFIDTQCLLLIALLNGVLGIFNIALIEGLDGMGIYEELLGEDEFVDRARSLLFNAKRKEELRQRGINGRLTIAACYIILLFQVLLPIILAMNVCNIFGISI